MRESSFLVAGITTRGGKSRTSGFNQETRPQIVIHLAAAVGGVGANCANAGRFYDSLITGATLIEHVRRAAVQKLVAVATVCSDLKFTSVPFRDEDLWNGYPGETNALA